jgi:hypothetical protein
MMILRMVIMHLILFISIMDIMSIILIMCITVWLESIGSQIVYELDHRKPVLYVIPIENILGKLPVVPVGQFCIICAIFFPVRQAIASRVLAMDAGCGSSIRGQWSGPVTCNEWEVHFGPCQPPCTSKIKSLV